MMINVVIVDSGCGSLDSSYNAVRRSRVREVQEMWDT